MIDLLGAACANVVVPDASPEAMSYYWSGNLLWFISQAWGFLIPILFLFTGFSGRLSKVSQKIGKKWFFAVAIYLAIYTILNQIIDLPLEYYAGFAREHAYGLSTQSLSGWIQNWTISTAIALIFSVAFIWIFFLLLKKSPRRWWIYGSVVGIAMTLFFSLIQPIWIDPLFNTYGPMKNKVLEGQILHLASKAGIENGRVYEVDKSKETKALNAYVIGIGKSNRIVLWDTTIDKLSTDQILFVMGHEMGHYVLHHIWWGLAFFSAMIFFVFFLTFKSVYFVLNKYHHRFGFSKVCDIAALPLFLLLINFFSLLTMPLQNYYSRTIEHNADIFGLEITKNNQAAGEAFVVLQEDNLANPRPGPLYTFWRCSHPPLADRVAFCNEYCPWAEGQPLKYGRFFDQTAKD
jgi:STE24 endopeptidase